MGLLSSEYHLFPIFLASTSIQDGTATAIHPELVHTGPSKMVQSLTRTFCIFHPVCFNLGVPYCSCCCHWVTFRINAIPPSGLPNLSDCEESHCAFAACCKAASDTNPSLFHHWWCLLFPSIPLSQVLASGWVSGTNLELVVYKSIHR